MYSAEELELLVGETLVSGIGEKFKVVAIAYDAVVLENSAGKRTIYYQDHLKYMRVVVPAASHK